MGVSGVPPLTSFYASASNKTLEGSPFNLNLGGIKRAQRSSSVSMVHTSVLPVLFESRFAYALAARDTRLLLC